MLDTLRAEAATLKLDLIVDLVSKVPTESIPNYCCFALTCQQKQIKKISDLVGMSIEDEMLLYADFLDMSEKLQNERATTEQRKS